MIVKIGVGGAGCSSQQFASMIGAVDITELGAYLERHREQAGLSKRAASRAAGISEGRWRQVVTGVQKAGGGIEVPVNPTARTVIGMATAVGADQSEALGLAGLTAPAPVEPQPGLAAASNDELLAEVRRRMEGGQSWAQATAGSEEAERDGSVAGTSQSAEDSLNVSGGGRDDAENGGKSSAPSAKNAPTSERRRTAKVTKGRPRLGQRPGGQKGR